MIAGLLRLLGGARTMLLGGVGIAAAAAIAVLWLQVSSARSELVAAKIEAERQAQKIVALELVVAGQRDALDEVENTNKELEKNAAELADQITEIRSAGPKDDASIAPVLQKALKRLAPKKGK